MERPVLISSKGNVGSGFKVKDSVKEIKVLFNPNFSIGNQGVVRVAIGSIPIGHLFSSYIGIKLLDSLATKSSFNLNSKSSFNLYTERGLKQ